MSYPAMFMKNGHLPPVTPGNQERGGLLERINRRLFNYRKMDLKINLPDGFFTFFMAQANLCPQELLPYAEKPGFPPGVKVVILSCSMMRWMSNESK